MPLIQRFLVLLILVGVSLAAPPAYAETKVKPDPAGDAPSGIDITRARYTHGDGRVKVFARVPALRRSGEATLSISRFGIFEAGYVVMIKKKLGEPGEVALYYFDHFGLEKRDCDGVSGTWGETSIRMSVPRSCLEGHAPRRVFAQVGISLGEQVDLAPAARRLARD